MERWPTPICLSQYYLCGNGASLVLLGYSQIWYESFRAQFKFCRIRFFPDFLNGLNNSDARSGPAGTAFAWAGTNLPYYPPGNNSITTC